MVPQVKNVTTQQIIANRCFTITTAVLTNQKQAPELVETINIDKWIYIHYIAKSIGSPPTNEQVWLL